MSEGNTYPVDISLERIRSNMEGSFAPPFCGSPEPKGEKLERDLKLFSEHFEHLTDDQKVIVAKLCFMDDCGDLKNISKLKDIEKITL